MVCKVGLGWLGSAHDRRRGWFGGPRSGRVAARSSPRGDGDLFRRIGSSTVTARWSRRSPRSSPSWRRAARPATTQRSYGMDLLRWFRFLWAFGVGWIRRRGSRPGISAAGCRSRSSRLDRIGGIRTVTPPDRVGNRQRRGQRGDWQGGHGDRYEARLSHCETVVRGFYDFHLEAGSGPMVNPFPLARHRGVSGWMRTTTGWSRSSKRMAGIDEAGDAGAGYPGRAVRSVVRAAGFAP